MTDEAQAILEQLPEILKRSPDLRYKLYELLAEQFASRNEIAEILAEMKSNREEARERFEAADRRFIDLDVVPLHETCQHLILRALADLPLVVRQNLVHDLVELGHQRLLDIGHEHEVQPVAGHHGTLPLAGLELEEGFGEAPSEQTLDLPWRGRLIVACEHEAVAELARPGSGIRRGAEIGQDAVGRSVSGLAPFIQVEEDVGKGTELGEAVSLAVLLKVRLQSRVRRL